MGAKKLELTPKQYERIITFGCRLNIYESEIITNNAQKAGMTNVTIFNSCAVTKSAEKKLKMCWANLKPML